MKHNLKVVIHSTLTPEERTEENDDANDEVSDGIRNRKMHAITDASMSHDQMGGC